ncbi:uncharacterized protein SRS1_16558 [Sporisorium reilianum f. sp. reilianum]|uniref:Uncharacterized protein n=1 Tax=Sporisorium reilianum f. sp. reilianum TaxID=72559 RepID=A0A2N8UCX8_9BASI|nr:uncharacterized protein SRS1_16558 [Sporisorium reilianum f. sp. reilianum]
MKQFRLMALAFAFAMLLNVFFAEPVRANVRDMVKKLHDTLQKAHSTSGKDWRVIGGPDYQGQFDAEALEIAENTENSAQYLGDDKPVLGTKYVGGMLPITYYGPREDYFYTLIRPTDTVGAKMGPWLAPNDGRSRLAVFLWKHRPGKADPKAVSVDIIEDTGFNWAQHLDNFQDVIRRTRG